MQDLWILVEARTDAMSAIFLNNRIMLTLSEYLNGIPDITEGNSRTYNLNAFNHALIGCFAQALGVWLYCADVVHPASVSKPTVFDHGHVNVDDISLFQSPITRNAMTYLLVDRGAYGFGEPFVTQRGRYAFLDIDNVVMA